MTTPILRADLRRAARTNMFIAAVAEIEGRSLPVRVRNMSQTGALLEGDAPLRPGARLALRRGENAAAGQVVWSDGHRAGIAFTEMVSVPAWMGRPALRDVEAQKRVDAIQAQIRAGAPVVALVEPPAPADITPFQIQQRLSEELVNLKRIVDEVGEQLSAEPAVLAGHAEAMQQFDIVSQTLGHLARLMIAEDAVAALGGIGMDSLRKRLGRS